MEGEKLPDLVRKDFINKVSKVITIQVTIDRLDYTKTKNFCSSYIIMINMKTCYKQRGNLYHIMCTGLVFRMYNNNNVI